MSTFSKASRASSRAAGAGQRPWPAARPTSRTAMNWANPWIG
ncbi:hypothetical protein [Streptomyces sp. KS 21]|nr:hypothetical protein [Streptomyces sp. KS 21]